MLSSGRALVGPSDAPVELAPGDYLAYPGDELAASFPNGRCETLRGVDHFATPESFGFFDAALEFLDAI